MIIIIGAGLAGLSTAYHLRDKDYKIFEKESRAGGLCRTTKVDGFCFDYTGHLLHLRQGYTKRLIQKLLPTGFKNHSRRAFIYSKGVYTPYPFQANTYRLPKEVVKECVMGFIETLNKRARVKGQGSSEESFEKWIYRTFGKGIARHFMIPYNKKVWNYPLSGLTSEWVSWAVPKPTFEEVINGALGIQNKQFGYNPTFLYPVKGGIEVLPRSFLPYIKNLLLDKEIVEIRPKERKVVLSDGRSEYYQTLVSTVPLPELIVRIKDCPVRIREAAKGLKYTSVYNINIGIDRDGISEKHWVYFPEREFPFYRVGFPMNFSKNIVPSGMSSIYIEVSHNPRETIRDEMLHKKVINGLRKCSILKPGDRIVVSDIQDIHCAYVIYDRHRQKVLPAIHEYLNKNDIYSIGRYGTWEYSPMEAAILQGREVAERVKGQGSRVKSQK